MLRGKREDEDKLAETMGVELVVVTSMESRKFMKGRGKLHLPAKLGC